MWAPAPKVKVPLKVPSAPSAASPADVPSTSRATDPDGFMVAGPSVTATVPVMVVDWPLTPAAGSTSTVTAVPAREVTVTGSLDAPAPAEVRAVTYTWYATPAGSVSEALLDVVTTGSPLDGT